MSTLSSRLIGKLARRELDFIVVPGPIPVPRTIKVDFGSCDFHWIANPSRFRSSPGVSPVEVAALPIITLPHEADVNDTMMMGVKPTRLSFCSSFSVVAVLVRKGLGISLLPADFFADDLAQGALISLSAAGDVPSPRYSAAYLPIAELSVLPEIAALARDESWFLTDNVDGGQDPRLNGAEAKVGTRLAVTPSEPKGWRAGPLSTPSAAEGGGRRPAFTAGQPSRHTRTASGGANLPDYRTAETIAISQ